MGTSKEKGVKGALDDTGTALNAAVGPQQSCLVLSEIHLIAISGTDLFTETGASAFGLVHGDPKPPFFVQAALI